MNHPSASARQESTPADRSPLRHDAATRRACSVFAVSHRLDGFLLLPLHGLVASRSQPWGSSGCGLRGIAAARTCPDARPSRAFPSRPAVPASPRRHAPLSLRDLREVARNFEAFFRPGVRCHTTSRTRCCARCSPGFPSLVPDGPEGPTVFPLPVAEAPSRRRNPGVHGRHTPPGPPEGVGGMGRIEARPPRCPPAEDDSDAGARAPLGGPSTLPSVGKDLNRADRATARRPTRQGCGAPHPPTAPVSPRTLGVEGSGLSNAAWTFGP